jgi:hypothetical protein
MINDINSLEWLQKWFYDNCNGDWEHNTNIKIFNLDNPGWSIYINLLDTPLENVTFDTFKDYQTEDKWIYCEVQNNMFKAACGPFQLIDVITIFRKWVESVTSKK